MGLLQAKVEEGNQGLSNVNYGRVHINILLRLPNSSVTSPSTPPIIMANRV